MSGNRGAKRCVARVRRERDRSCGVAVHVSVGCRSWLEFYILIVRRGMGIMCRPICRSADLSLAWLYGCRRCSISESRTGWRGIRVVEIGRVDRGEGRRSETSN